VKEKDGSYWALGSAHCVFYYSGSFATLPVEMCPYVESIYIYKQLNHWETCNQLKYDVVAIHLTGIPVAYNSSFQWNHDTPIPDPVLGPRTNVGGLSNIAYVYGENLVYDPTEEVYLFKEDSEPGDSGTLIFGLTQPPTFIGVYQGTRIKRKGMKPRGVVVPVRISDMSQYFPEVLDPTITMGVPHPNSRSSIVSTNFKITPYLNFNTIGSYQDGSEIYYGIRIKHEVTLCGSHRIPNIQRCK